MTVGGPPGFDVVHVSSVHLWDDNRIFRRECRSLAASGFRVALVARAEGVPDVGDVEVVPFPSFPGRVRRLVHGLPAMLRLLRGIPARTYHLHDPELVALIPWLRLRGARVVYDAHEDLPMQMLAKTFPVPGANRALSLLARLVCWSVGRSCHAVVAATAPVARRFPARRTRVVRNFPEVLTDLDDLPYRDRSNTVIYVGGLSEVRGALTMIEAARQALPDGWRLRLVGPVEQPWLRRSTAGEARPHVQWEGRVSPPEARAMMTAARIGMVVLQPTRAYVEALPTKLFEYMAAGLPVIASDFPAWRDIVEGSRCGLLVDPCDPGRVADAMRYLVEHPEEAEAMGERGREAVERHLNWASEQEALIDLHARLAT